MTKDVATEARIRRLKAESFELSRRYGEVRYDKKDGAWLHVARLPLPAGWNKHSIEILIDVPWGTPGYPSVAPQWFWTDQDLKTNDGTSIGHFFTHGTAHTDQKYVNQGWGHFCIHVNRWQPSPSVRLRDGHSLITYLDLIRAVFNDRRALSR